MNNYFIKLINTQVLFYIVITQIITHLKIVHIKHTEDYIIIKIYVPTI